MNPAPPPISPPEKPQRKSWPSVIALVLAFLPAAFLLSMEHIYANRRATTAELVWASVLSLVFCITSSLLLFTRKRIWAILLGVLLLLLNLAIAFFLGCVAVLNQVNH
jgi:hypothetical protein